jgi:hypothetical protein
MIMEKQLTYWWFSELKTDYSGIAWYGKNDVSEGVGISWCAINNPHPHKKIKSIVVQSSQNNNIYAVLAITLSNQKHYVPVNPVSFGGPDDWAAATNMSAMVKGLAGVTNSPNTEAFIAPVISPRWITANVDSVNATIRFAASKGYVAYNFINDEKKHIIHLTATTGGNKMFFHILLPENSNAKSVTSNGKNISFKQSHVEKFHYADFETDAFGIKTVDIKYE